jgi:acetyl esterase/lipase
MAQQLPDPPEPVLEKAASTVAAATAGHPRSYELPPERGRARLVALQSDPDVPRPDADEEWVTVDAGRWGPVRTRLVRPKGATGPLPVILYVHGGGWVFGDDVTHDRLVRELAVGAEAVAVFPVYDPAPEAKYPSQVEQVFAVGNWVVEHGAEHGMDTMRIAVCGDSAGGAVAAAFAIMTSERGGIDLKGQVLLYPVTDAGFRTASYLQFAEGYYLTREGMMWFWDQYTDHPAQRQEVHAAPLRASLEQLRGLPPALVVTGEADVLRDEGEAYAALLRQAGVDVTAVRVGGVVHDFLLLDSLRETRGAEVARRLAIDALNRIFGR